MTPSAIPGAGGIVEVCTMRMRRGFSFLEVMIVALISGGAMIFLLSMGQANAQLSAINQQSLLARQVAMDLLEYYGHNLEEAFLVASPQALPDDFFVRHPAFSDTLALSPQMAALWTQMAPKIVLDLEPSVMVETTGIGNPDLHRLVCKVTWQEGPKTLPRTMTLARLAATFR